MILAAFWTQPLYRGKLGFMSMTEWHKNNSTVTSREEVTEAQTLLEQKLLKSSFFQLSVRWSEKLLEV